MNLSRIYSNLELFLVGLILMTFVAGLAHISSQRMERENAIGAQLTRSSSPKLGD